MAEPAAIPPTQVKMPTKPRMTLEQKKRYITIYPHYIDATLSPKEGRKITLVHCPRYPKPEEIFYVVQQMGYNDIYLDVNKSYPRAQSKAYCIPPLHGTVHVDLSKNTKNAEMTKSQLLCAIGDTLLKQEGREAKPGHREQEFFGKAAEDLSKIMSHTAKDKSRRRGKVTVVRK